MDKKGKRYDCVNMPTSKVSHLNSIKYSPRISAPSGDDGLLRRRHVGVAEDAFENGDAATDNDVIGDVLHDRGGLAGDKGQQYGGLVQVPEQKKLSPAEKTETNVRKIIQASLEVKLHNSVWQKLVRIS